MAVPAASSRSKERNLRRGYRERILGALQAAEFELSGEVLKADEDRFFSADFAYPSEFGAGQGLRPHLRVEMAMQPSMLAPVERPIRSLIAELQQQPPEVAAFACVDPVETAADKLSALAWRVCARQRGEENDDPTIIRHLHDLAALETHVTASPDVHAAGAASRCRRHRTARGPRTGSRRRTVRHDARSAAAGNILGGRVRRIRARGLERIRPAYVIAWSLWRRAHQAAAQKAHFKRNSQL